MGWLKSVDDAIQARLEALQINGAPALRTVGPLPARVRSTVAPAVLDVDKPAMLYAIEQIQGGNPEVSARVEAILIAEGLRGASAAWRGDADTTGAYELAEAVAGTLAETDLAGTAGAWLRQQRLAHADGRIVALAQEYDVPASGEAILLDGQDLVGSRSIMRLAYAAGQAAWQSEGFVGSEERWAKWQGRGPERIVVKGTLWAQSETELAAIEQGIDDLLRDDQLHSLSVGAQRSWQDVALVEWERTAEQAQQPLLGLVGQPTRLEFEQYRR